MNSLKLNHIYWGDTLEVLKTFPDECVDTIITSPPYWGLRSYLPEGHPDKQKEIGLEQTLDEYLNKLLAITAELKRVLRKTGTLWWNHGDCYGGSGCGKGDYRENKSLQKDIYEKPNPQLKLTPKCLALQNYRLIIKMIDEQGWLLRNCVIWRKPNSMPQSVKDRLSNTYEPVFLLVKSKKYYFSLDAIRIPQKYPEDVARRIKQDREAGVKPFQKGNPISLHLKNSMAYNWSLRNTPNPMEWRENANRRGRGSNNPKLKNRNFMPIKNTAERYKEEWEKQKALSYGNDDKGAKRSRVMAWLNTKEDIPNALGKNPGDCWSIPTSPLPKEIRGAHFASFPPSLIEPMIKAGCPPKGIVLDPFFGVGTSAAVAKKLGRKYVGIELNKEYISTAKKRIKAIIYQPGLYEQ